MRDRVSLETVSLSLPFGIGSMSWKVNTTEKKAAWSLYVELVTRIAVQPLALNQGLVREAMNSLYSLFGTTREILKAAGPEVGASRDSVGGIAIAVLNNGLRPFLSKWHPLLQAWEARRPVGVSPKEHEQSWSEEATARRELEALRVGLEEYAHALATIAGVEE
ncbi:hypothetical protein H6G76_18330 [Nostoc sp. FACHB-152]|uniref:hypothetical protein n=1 Tax=unclassified Nostoc TaxID=2593658 RepID=UPI001687B774|nr:MULTISPECIES: hypothetical protein [unclassified Nostoc]MBD2449076.1 hypothetical protein [Nostoc sp. FACHB-152]MBD2471020.1 hypothetical protein [Nostoc sp. FACHB-145]